MSRAYRVRMRTRVQAAQFLEGRERARGRLDILEVLPPEEMAAILTAELQQGGFAERDGRMTRTQDDVTVSVEVATGQFEVALFQVCRPGEVAEMETDVRDGTTEIAGDSRQLALDWQREVSRRLEILLPGVAREMCGVEHRVVAEALKRKAASLGRIRDLSEDPRTGSLSMTVEF